MGPFGVPFSLCVVEWLVVKCFLLGVTVLVWGFIFIVVVNGVEVARRQAHLCHKKGFEYPCKEELGDALVPLRPAPRS